VYTFGTWRGLEEHKKVTAANMLKVFTFTHHIITNPIIQITGDTAIGSYRSAAAMGIKATQGEKVIYGGATYIQECVRTPQGWRVQRHIEENPWMDDEGGNLLALMSASA
jgi:hypothetical protein